MSMSATALNDPTRWRKSGHKCPACERELWMLPLTEGMIYFCGWGGSCPSLAANDGARSIEQLHKNVEEEPEYKETGDWWGLP